MWCELGWFWYEIMTGVVLMLGIWGMVIKKGAEAFELAAHGKSAYAIVSAGHASPAERRAAGELQYFIQLATGARLPLVDERDPRASRPPRIFIGAGTLSENILGEVIDLDGLGDEGFILRSVGASAGPDLIIAGGRRRGTLYGVYTLLDRLGFRWYTNRKTWFPEGGVLQMGAIQEQDAPAFIYREPYIYEGFDADWAVRNRVNSNSAGLDQTRGGKVGVLGVHTFRNLIPYSLFNEHPEYFPLIGGQRVTGYVQRCLSNRDVVRVAAENMIAWMDENPEGVFFSLSQEDTEQLCECIPCTQKMKEEESPMGLYLDFVNQVAAIVEAKHPDKFVSTLAYWFTEKPPKSVRPRHNVFIRLCPITICSSHPFSRCQEDASRDFKGYLQEWAKITDRIIIWHYNTNFNNFPMPFPNFAEFTEDIKTYRHSGVQGIFFQGSAHGPGGGDADLRAWVMARLLWEPHQDAAALVEEWMRAVYGPAYKPMRAYYELIHQQVAAADRHLHIFEPVTRQRWPDTVVVQMEELHQEALALAVGDETALYYVRKSHMAVKFVNYVLNTGRLQVLNAFYRPVDNGMDLEDYNQLSALLEEFEVRAIREESLDSNFLDLLRQRLETHPVVGLENQDLRLEVVPRLGGRIVGLIDKKSGTNLLHLLGPEDNYYPVEGGYGESTTDTWGCTGFANPYEVQLNGKSLKLSSVSKGLRFERRITLSESGAKIDFSSSITNENESTTTYRLMCKMYLRADSANIALKALTPAGVFLPPKASEEKRDHFKPEMSYRFDAANKPAGIWRLENLAGGFTMQNAFSSDQVEACRLITSAADDWVRMEIQTSEREVPPGGVIVLDHSWEVQE